MAQRHYPDFLKQFVEYASFGEAPLKMLFWTGVSAVAGALRRNVWLDQKYFQWIPNFYIIFVAPPGIVSKSTTANIGMNLLRELPDIVFGPDVITWQALVTTLAAATKIHMDEKTGENFSMSAVSYCSDELGNLLNPSDRDLVDVLVSLWDGKRGVFSKDTKTQGSDKVTNPFVNIIGCTTPAWISGHFPEYLVGGGFTSRCVFVYADRKRQLVPYVDEVVPKEFEEIRQKLIHDLEIISTLFGEFQLSPAARAWGKAWYIRHWDSPPGALSGDQFSGYLARKQTHLHKLAMVLSASANNSLIILPEHLQLAEAMTSAIEADMPKVFSRMGQNEITRGSLEIVALVEKYPGITQTALFRMLFRTLSYKDFADALRGAINSGHIIPHQSAGSAEMGFVPRLAEGSSVPDEPQNRQVN